MDNSTTTVSQNSSVTSGEPTVRAGANHVISVAQNLTNPVPQSFSNVQQAKTIDMIGEEFVPRLKTEPEQEDDIAVPSDSVNRPSVVMSVPQEQVASLSAASDQPNLVYCNLNDLDLEAGAGEPVPVLTAGGQNIIGDQVVTTTANHQQILQMVQAVPGLQISGVSDKNPYSAVSTILLQGGILQLKSDGSTVSNVVSGPSGQLQVPPAEPQQVTQVIHLPVEQKISSHDLAKTGVNMVSSQVVSSNGNVIHTSRPQDAIANILASMNTAGAVDHSDYGQEVVSVVSGLGGEERTEIVPLNLATSSPHVATIQQPQTIQVQGYRKLAQTSPGGCGLVTKKVIIATINGQQRILTPVSSPQLIAVKNPNGGAPRLVAADQNVTLIQQKPVIQKQVITTNPVIAASVPAPVNTSPHSKTSDNKTCRWKFENGQICGKVFTKTYNLTVHMRMHQDIRPFPCTICEQTFRQKAHLQRHEATHGIDSTAGRKRRKKSLLEMANDGQLLIRKQEGRMSESEEEDDPSSNGAVKIVDNKRPKLSVPGVKSESDPIDIDPMIEPIEGGAAGSRKLCPVTVGTNTEITPDVRQADLIDDLEEDMEPVRYKGSGQGTLHVEQGVQYCEADLLPQEEKFVGASEESTSQEVFIEEPEHHHEEGEAMNNMKTELVYASQGGQYVNENGEYIDDPQQPTQLITSDGSFIDASSNHLVMSDGALVSLVPEEPPAAQENVVNIVTSTATNEQGQQIIIIDNLDQHSPELQREIMKALMADHTIVPISQ